MIPTVLLYNLDSEKGRQIKTLCLTLRLRARSVAQEDFSQPLESVLGLALRKDSPEGGELFSDELLVMAGLSPARWTAFSKGSAGKRSLL